jgi:uncharacterized protein YdhG (YjbR/CyaY superfamily)
MPTQKTPRTVDDYIATFAPNIQIILQKIRQTVKAAAPDAEETISYRIPAFKLNGMLRRGIQEAHWRISSGSRKR